MVKDMLYTVTPGTIKTEQKKGTQKPQPPTGLGIRASNPSYRQFNSNHTVSGRYNL